MTLSDPRDPAVFWERLTNAADRDVDPVPDEPAGLLTDSLPPEANNIRLFPRRRVGLGSLGKPRFAAVADWHGCLVGREVKARTPPAGAFLRGTDNGWEGYGRIVAGPHRCPDPFFRLEDGWVVRRLSPDCNRIELQALRTVRDVAKLLRAMGAETANIHLGTPGVGDAIQADLAGRPQGWLRDTARRMLKAVTADWKEWRAATQLHSTERSQ